MFLNYRFQRFCHQTKVLALKAWNLIGRVGDSMLATREVGDKPLEMETKAISMVLNRQLPREISNKSSLKSDEYDARGLTGKNLACSMRSDRGDGAKQREQKKRDVALHYPNAWNRLVKNR